MKVMLTEEQLRQGVADMARKIQREYAGLSPTIIGVLTGSIVLMADLIRLLDMPLRVGVVYASSYRGNSTTRGPLVINSDLMPDVAGRHVLLVDDIFDTGHTLLELISRLEKLQPKSIRSAVLLQKHGRKEVDMQPEFIGFEIPNEFVVGYGLDYRDAYRNLPYVAALEDAEISSSSA
jgi:hypoxanthine phosphoribosyltransferase